MPLQCSWVYPVELLRLRSVGRPPAAFFPRRSRLIARSPLILATVVARLLLLAGKSLFACDLRARRQPPRTRGVKLPQWTSYTSHPWRKVTTVVIHRKLSYPAYPAYPAYFDNWCSLRKFCSHEGIGNRCTVSSPHTPQPFHISFPSRLSATVST